MLAVWRALSLLCNGWPAAARRQEKGFPPAQVGGNEDEDRLIKKKGWGDRKGAVDYQQTSKL